MQQTSVKRITMVHAIVCDRCGGQACRGGVGNHFKHMTSLGFTAQEGSIFGQGQRVDIDLCDPCMRIAPGKWLREWTPAEGKVGANLATKLSAFDPARHGGEFPAGDGEALDDVFRSLALADADEAAAQTPPPSVQTSLDVDAWIPVAQLFNRLADGATLEQILQAFPAISQNAACDALREAALRFPPYASFHRAVDAWTPRYPYER